MPSFQKKASQCVFGHKNYENTILKMLPYMQRYLLLDREGTARSCLRVNEGEGSPLI
jgi:hypothetical protein